MTRSPLRPLSLALAALALLAAPGTAWAAEGDRAGALLFGPALLALPVFAIGLAAHLLLVAVAPERGRSLVAQAERPRGRLLVLGLVDTLFLWFVALAIAKPAPAISGLVLLIWLGLAFVGSHGLARALGARVLGRDPRAPAPEDVRQLAVGWFVLTFAAALPLVGLLLAAYWSVRATGAVLLTLLVGPPPREPQGG